MKKSRQSVFFSILFVVAYLLNACSGMPAGAQQLSDDQNNPVTSVGTELSGEDDVNDNSDVDNENEADTNDDDVNDNDSNSNDDQDENSNSDDDVDNGNENGDDNGNDDDQGENEDQEVIGIVEAITADSITVNGVTYLIADFTEFNDLISIGDEVKLHVIVNADGTLTISEIEKTDETSVDDGNSNANDDGDDDDQGEDDDDQGEDDNGDDDGGNSNDDD